VDDRHSVWQTRAGDLDDRRPVADEDRVVAGVLGAAAEAP
jgi:hypothetical protein